MLHLLRRRHQAGEAINSKTGKAFAVKAAVAAWELKSTYHAKRQAIARHSKTCQMCS